LRWVLQVQGVADAAGALLSHVIVVITIFTSITACSCLGQFQILAGCCIALAAAASCYGCHSSTAALAAWLWRRQLHLQQ
jgi:xanthine/uracil permease